MDLARKKLGLMLSTGPERPVNLDTAVGLSEATLARGGQVYLYLIDDGVRALDDRPAAAQELSAIVESVSQVQGAFSFLMITKDRLIAVRDPHGFRPLAIGKLGDAWVVCSETCAMDLIGASLSSPRFVSARLRPYRGSGWSGVTPKVLKYSAVALAGGRSAGASFMIRRTTRFSPSSESAALSCARSVLAFFTI